MKNFARLVRFAWSYRARFGLSLVCAVMVALLWSANISAVYPLLKILFYSENCQKWVAEKIVAKQTELCVLDARLAELEVLDRLGEPTGPGLKAHFQDVHADRDARQAEIQQLERQFELEAPMVAVRALDKGRTTSRSRRCAATSRWPRPGSMS